MAVGVTAATLSAPPPSPDDFIVHSSEPVVLVAIGSFTVTDQDLATACVILAIAALVWAAVKAGKFHDDQGRLM